MSDFLKALQADFAKIANDADLHEFGRKYGLHEVPVKLSPTSQVLSVQTADIEGVHVRLTHRWVDPSGPFQNVPDINKLKLEFDGREVRLAEFSD